MNEFTQYLQANLDDLDQAGLYKAERLISSSQNANITVANGKSVLNLCANNYLGLANNEEVIAAAKKGLDQNGFGMASVRFICGTQNIHKTLESKLSEFLGTIVQSDEVSLRQ